MKKFIFFSWILASLSVNLRSAEIPDCYNEVDQVLWVVSDAENTMVKYRELGFDQFRDLEIVEIKSWKTGQNGL